jgi:protein gp37
MEKSKIDWTDSTWNVVTGCFHDCPYCYARSIANRFGCASEISHDAELPCELEWFTGPEGKIHELDEPIYDYDRGHKAPYPYEFDPTFYKYRLNDYAKKKGRNIFVCSMADLFGAWVPDEWIEEVFEACKAAPQHNYMFLTKNPQRYLDLEAEKKLPWADNFWFGTSITNPNTMYAWFTEKKFHWFVSIEPILEDIGDFGGGILPEWIIVGAETGNRKDKVVPEKSWIDNIVRQCRENNIPIFMKESLRALYGDSLIQEFPEGLRRE